MTGDETHAFDALTIGDRTLLAAFAKAKAELDDASRSESLAENALDRARERLVKAQAAYAKAAEAVRAILPSIADGGAS